MPTTPDPLILFSFPAVGRSSRFAGCRRGPAPALRIGLACLTLLLGIAAIPDRLIAAPRVDQQQTVLDTSTTSQAIGNFAEQIVAQTITVGLSGFLTEVRLAVGCTATSNLVIEIQQVTPATLEPSGVVLTSETVAGSVVGPLAPVTASLKRFPLSSPVGVSSGSVVAIVLRSAGACSTYQGPPGDAYAPGRAVGNARPNPLGVWVSFLSGSGFDDIPFQTVVDESTGPDPLKKTVVDQEQPMVDATVGGLSIGGASEQIVAQVVTAGLSGTLRAVGLPVACDTAATLVVEIQGVDAATGQPDHLALTTETLAGAAMPAFFPAPPTLRPLVFSTPVAFAAGDQFAVVLKSPGQCAVFQGPVGDPYPGGDSWFDARPNPLGVWVEISLGAGRSDLPFETFVE